MPDTPLRILGVGLGSSINFQRWAGHLAKRGHEVHIVSDRYGNGSAVQPGVTTHRLQELEPMLRVPGVRRFRLAGAVGRLAERLGADIVHAHYLLPYGYWAAESGTHPLVVSPWGTDILVAPRESERGRRWATRAIAAADWLVVNSDANERASIELGADPARMSRIIWYSELERFSPDRFDPGLRARFGWPDDALVVLSLRKFKPDCNLDVLARAFARVARDEPRARLIIAAQSGPLRPQIEKLVDELGIRPVTAFVNAARDELPALVASADLTVSITNSDSTPASLLETMASGLPAVCGIAPSIDEWVGQGDGAELVPPQDEGAVAAAILTLLRDPELRRAYGERNERFVRAKLSDPGAALEELYREVIAS